MLYLHVYAKIILGGDTNFLIIKEGNMEAIKKQSEANLFTILDKGIDDMEAGRELPLEEAFQKMNDFRENRRRAQT